MTTTALEVRIHQAADRVDVNRFTSTLGEVATALREIDRASSDPGEQRARWLVDDLDHQDRVLTVRLSPETLHTKRPSSSLLVPVEALVSGVRGLNAQPELPEFYSEATVERLIKIGDPGRGVRSVSLAAVNGEAGPRADLSDLVLRNARDAIREHETSLGTIVGTLDILNGRSRSRVRASVFDATTRRAVTATAAPGLADAMRDAWGHPVALIGRITRNERGQAVKVAIESIERLPEDDTGRPSTTEVLGIDPLWLDGQPVDEYLAEARRG